MKYKKHKKVKFCTKHLKTALCVLLAVILAVSAAACELLSPQQFELESEGIRLLVHFIDVGQGDSILLESKGEFVLIDAGEAEYGGDVTSYIRSRRAKQLKYVIATHPHSDHIGGLTEVIDSIDTRNFITVETDQSTRTWMDVLDAVDRHDINYIDAVAGETYSFGEASFTIMAPLSDRYEGYNNYSVVTKVCCGNVSFLLTGDAEKTSEYEMVKAGEDLHADVLKCGHHGSSSSSTAKFLKAVDPSYAVITCGRNNDYGHPHPDTLKKLALLNCPVYRTDRLGTIIVLTDGETIRFRNEEGELATPAIPGSEKTTYYVGNLSSRVFHLSTCSGVYTMNPENRYFFSSRDEAIAEGYTPCSMCRP